MEQIKTLGEIIKNLNTFDPDETIYAIEPWNENSKAMVMEEPEDGSLPEEAIKIGMVYFIGVNTAIEFIEDWIPTQKKTPKPEAICKRLIKYAINDA